MSNDRASEPVDVKVSLSLRLVPCDDCPNSSGLFFMSSMDLDYEISPVAIISKMGVLVACDMYLGQTELEAFHSGLTDVKWYKVG